MRIAPSLFRPAPFRPVLFRSVSALALGGLLSSTILAPWARAQPAPPPGAAPPAGDPPSLVGSLSQVSGTVSFHTADQTQWAAATLNYPVTSGDAVWTEPGAHVELVAGAMRVAMNGQTELDVDTLDQQTFAVTTPQGEIFLRVGDLPLGASVAVATPRGAVAITAPGEYDIVAGDTDHPTEITVVDGAAHIGGGSLSLDLTARQTATLTGASTFDGKVGNQQSDAFLRAELTRDRPRVVIPSPSAPPPVVLSMTGGEALESVGQWTPAPEYGEVWYPPVAADWVPYRDGHWAYVQPWGWTWVDDAPWGFAPSHYGRWVEIRNRWAWNPEIASDPYVGPPVYAPALVNFVDIGAGVAVGAAVGLGVAAAVGWIPLGPREAYVPPYRASDNYFRDVNAGHVTNITTIQNFRADHTTINNFTNRGALTVVSGATLAASRPVARNLETVAPQVMAAARPVAEPPVRPTLATAGVTPGMARALNLPAAPAGMAARPAAPGPSVVARAPGAVPLRASLGTPAVPSFSAPAQGAQPERAGIARPGGLPPLAAPGARPAAPAGQAPGPEIRAREQPGVGAPPRAPEPFAAARPGAIPLAARPAEPPRPAEPTRAPEPGRPLVQERPATPPPVAQTRPAEPPRPAEPLRAPEPGRPLVQERPATPPPVAQTRPAEPPRPAELLRAPEPGRPAVPQRPAAPPPVAQTRPVEPVRPVEPPRASAPLPAVITRSPEPPRAPPPVAAARPVEPARPAFTPPPVASRPAEPARPAPAAHPQTQREERNQQ